ncbi:MAG: hypothetical protein Kow0077_21240 [Anaerolineae bacterium]
MEIIQLETFVRAAHERSFTRTAEALGLTQPSVSARIAGLEAELGGALFERTGRSLNLTALGERFLPYAQRVLAVLEEGQHVVQAFQSGESGTLRLAALTSMMHWLLPDVLSRFQQTFPYVYLRVTLRNYSELPAALYDHIATLGISGYPHYDHNLPALLRFEFPIIPVVGASHPLATHRAEGRTLHVDELCDYRIMRVNFGPRVLSFVEPLQARARARTGAGMISLPASMAPAYAARGNEIAFLPAIQVQPLIESGALVALEIEDLPTLTVSSCLIKLREYTLNPTEEAFVQMFRARWRQFTV